MFYQFLSENVVFAADPDLWYFNKQVLLFSIFRFLVILEEIPMKSKEQIWKYEMMLFPNTTHPLGRVMVEIEELNQHSYVDACG